MPRKRSIVLDSFGASLHWFRWISLALFVVYFLSGITVIQPGEVALVLRFGKLRGESRGEQIRTPGLLIAMPQPFETVIRVPFKQEGEVVIDALWNSLSGVAPVSDDIDPVREGYCLTGDQNILQTRLVAKYRIDDPVVFALSVEDSRGLVHDAVMAAATETIASWRVIDTLRLRDDQSEKNLASVVQLAAQDRLDRVGCGLVLSSLEFKEMHPPRHLRGEFEQVQSARVEKTTLRREAEGFASQEIPRAEAERNRLIQEASANGTNLLARATAEVSVFRTLRDEYRRDPVPTAQRIYRESLQEVMARIGKRYLVPPESRPGDVRIFVSESETTK